MPAALAVAPRRGSTPRLPGVAVERPTSPACGLGFLDSSAYIISASVAGTCRADAHLIQAGRQNV